MTSFWRKAKFAALFLTVAALVLLSGVASATVLSVEITAPMASAPVYARPGGTVQVTGKVTTGEEQDVRIDVTIGASAAYKSYVHTAADGGSWSCTFNVTANVPADAPDGSLDIAVSAYDIDDDKTATETGAVIVDGTKPTIDDTSWLIGSSAAEGLWINATKPTLTVAVSDAAPSSGFDDDGSIASVDVTPSHAGITASCDPVTGLVTITIEDDLPEGANTVTLIIADNAGNESTQQSVTFNVDITAPVIDDSSWNPGEDEWIASTSTDLTVSVSDGEGSGVDEDTADITVSDSGVAGDPSFDSISGTLTIPLTGLSEGANTVWVLISDEVGNESTQQSVTFNVDITGPAFANAYPANGLETNATSLAPHIDITDDGVGLDTASISWNVAGGIGGTPTWNAPTSTFTPSSALSLDGTYLIKVTAEDSLDNSATYPSSGTWSFLLDTTPPATASVSISDSTRDIGSKMYTTSTLPEIIATVEDGGAAPSGFNDSGTISIAVYRDAAHTAAEIVPGTVTPSARPGANADAWSATWSMDGDTPLAEGDYYIVVAATDDAGNEKTFADFVFAVDTTGPSASGQAEVGVANNSNGSRFTNSRIITATWGASTDPLLTDGTAGSGLLGYTLEVWEKAEGDLIPTGDLIYSEHGGIYDEFGQGLMLLPASGSGKDTWASSVALPFVSGHSYGVWLTAYDMLHNPSEPFDPPFIFDEDAPSVPGSPAVMGLVGTRTRINTPTLQWANSTDQKAVAQSGVDLYEVQVSVATDNAWVSTTIDIPDEDVDLLDSDDAPLTGAFSWIIPNPLADGTYDIRVRAKDVAGNYSDWATIAPFEIDTVPPAVPGMPTTTSPTSNTTPTWTWTAVAGADHYSVYADGVKVAEPTTATYPSAMLADGIHVLEVASVDDLGNESARSTPGHVEIDTVAPNVPVMNPMPSHGMPGNITFSWSASDDDLATRYRFQYQKDGDAGWSSHNLQVQSFTVDAGSFVDGDILRARVRAIDAADNASAWSEVTVTIDATAPAVNWTSEPTSPTADPNCMWTWEGDDGETGSGIDHFVVSLDLEPLFVTKNDLMPDSGFYGAVGLTHGTHILLVSAVDKAGNQSWPVTSEVIVDTLPPAAPVMAPLAAGYNTSPISVAWSVVTDGDDNTISYDLQWATNEAFSAPTLVSPATSPHGFAPAADGQYWFRVRTISTLPDAGGTKTGDWSLPVSTVFDTTAPAAPVLTLETPDPTNASPQTWSWSTPADALGHVKGYKISVDGAPFEDVDDVNTYQTFFATSGYYSFAVMAYDWLGNEDEANAATETVTVDRTSPGLPGNLRLVGASPTRDSTPTWEWDAAANEDEDLAGYELLLDGVHIIDVGDALVYTHSEMLSDGSHTMQARSYDLLGNTSEWTTVTAGTTVVVDTAPPVTPGMPIAASPTRDQTPTWTWVAVSNVAGDLDGYNVYLDGSFAAWVDYDPNNPAPEFEYTPGSDLGHGVHLLEITSVDLLLNESARSTPGHVQIDIIAPNAPLMNPMPAFSKAADITFSWSAADDDLEVIYRFERSLDEGTTWAAAPDQQGQSYTFDAGLCDDGDTVRGRVMAIDAVGNLSSWSAEVSTTIDKAAPVVAAVTTPQLRGDNPTPTWGWSVTETGSGVAYFLVTLDGELPVRTPGTSLTFTPASRLIDGSHTLTVVGVDNVGNEGTPLVFDPVVIDTTAPGVPGMPVPDEDPTNDNTVEWTWTPSTGDQHFSHYNVYLDGTKMGGMYTDPNYTTPPMGHGLHVLEVTAVDDLGNESARSTAGHVFVDLIAPNVPIMNPMPAFSKAGFITFSWSAADDDLETRYRFQYRKTDDIGWTTITNQQGQSYAVDVPEENALVEARVRAIDAVGNESNWSAIVSTTVDGSAPVVNPVLPPETDPPVPVRTANAQPTWEWIGVDGYEGSGDQGFIVGGSGVAYYNVTLDGEWMLRTTSTSFTPASKLVDGLHTLKVGAVDNVGNVGEDYTLVEIIIDTTAPEVPGMPVPEPGSDPNHPYITRDTTPTWNWTASLDSDDDLVYYNVYADGVKVASVPDPTYTSVQLSDGLHVLEVTAVDDLGNESAKSTQGHVLVDTKAPSRPRMNPMPQFSKPGAITFSWSASDDDLDVRYRFQYSLNGGSSWFSVPGLQRQSFIVDASDELDAPNGAVIIGQVMAIDSVGNASDYSPQVSTIIDRHLPEVIADSPIEELRTRDTRPTWVWHGNDNFDQVIGSGIAHYLVTLDGEWPLQTTGTSFRPSYNLAEGEHVLKVKAVDNVGNVGDEITFVTVIIDTTPPPVPNMPRANAIGMFTIENPTGDSTPRWTWTEVADPDPDGDFDHYNVYLDNRPAVNVGTNREYTPSFPLAHGRHVLQVTSVDDLGNESMKSSQGEVWVDLIAPNVPRMDPMPAWSKPGTITFSWSAADDDLAVTYEFQYRLNGGLWITVPLDLQGQLWPVDASGYADGTVVYGRVRAIDQVGNESGWSVPVSTTIDGTAPVTTFTAPTADVRTNAPTYTWTWNSVDAGCGTVGYWVKLDNGGAVYQTEPTFTPHILQPGDHTVTVRAVDALGNIENPVTSAIVTVVQPVIIRVTPSPETYPINMISTVAFEVAGMIDADFVVSLGAKVLTGDPVNNWRVMAIFKSEPISKYYVLLDEEVLQPGQLLINVRAGLMDAMFIFDVLNERSGFGFGRLRPW